MGNVHSLAHRVTALSMACLASAGVILCTLSGFSCSYLSINAQPDRNIMTPWGQELVNEDLATIGVKCDSPFYEDTDRMWNLSQLFLMVSLGFGAATTVLAWALSTFVAPTKWSWHAMSILSAITAVMQVPMFLIFESEPCNMDIGRQTCSLALGSYFNIVSVGLWVIMTLWTQFLNPPRWTEDTDVWRRKIDVNEITIPSQDEYGTDGSLTLHPNTASSPRDPDGGFLVSSHDDNGIAVWTMGSGHKESRVVHGDDISEVSSISDGGHGHGQRDIESSEVTNQHRSNTISSFSPTTKQQADTNSNNDPSDGDVRKGASVVIDTLREKTRSLRDSARSYKLPKFEISTGEHASNNKQAHTVDPSTAGITAKDRMSAQGSEYTEDEPGIKVTIICPDGSREEANFGSAIPTCFAGDGLHLGGEEEEETQPNFLSTEQGTQDQQSFFDMNQEVALDDDDDVEMAPPAGAMFPSLLDGAIASATLVSKEDLPSIHSLNRVPVSSVVSHNPNPSYDYDYEEDVSEMSQSQMTSGESERTHMVDALSILQDLAGGH